MLKKVKKIENQIKEINNERGKVEDELLKNLSYKKFIEGVVNFSTSEQKKSQIELVSDSNSEHKQEEYDDVFVTKQK